MYPPLFVLPPYCSPLLMLGMRTQRKEPMIPGPSNLSARKFRGASGMCADQEMR